MTGREVRDVWLQEDDGAFDALPGRIDAAIAEAVRAEREACELAILRRRDELSFHCTSWWVVDSVADAIRARNTLYPPQGNAANPLFEGGDAK